jgi:hypothetical protein
MAGIDAHVGRIRQRRHQDGRGQHGGKQLPLLHLDSPENQLRQPIQAHFGDSLTRNDGKFPLNTGLIVPIFGLFWMLNVLQI